MTNQATKKPFFDIIRNMRLFIKKWWLLENLRKEISRHSGYQSIEELSAGRKVLVSQQFFISGRKDLPEFPGLAEKSFWMWRNKKYNEKELKQRIQEYNDICEVCIKEGLIEISQTVKGPMLSCTTPSADKISGWFGLLEGLLSQFNRVWTLIITVLTTIISSKIISSIWGLFK